jgi:RTX calcium-binding nonapeptide repeat (4 copies)
MRLRASLLSLTLIAAFPAAASSAASDASSAERQELCFGQVPTIVGKPGKEVVGTKGSDVVITNGAFGARTLGGDDLLCVTGETGIPDPQLSDGGFSTGDGSDRIDATGGKYPYPIQIDPGPGSDEVLGGPHKIFNGDITGIYVYAHDGSQGDADIIHTGDGPDSVDAGTDDVVHLGADADQLSLRATGDSSGSLVEGGPGRDSVVLQLWDLERPYSWEIDTRSGRLTREGELVALLSGFSDFDSVQARGPLRFTGSDRPETFDSGSMPPPELPAGSQLDWPVVVQMRGGNDVVRLRTSGADLRYNGGDGTDWFRFSASSDPLDRAFLDLATGALRYNGNGLERVRTRVANFENVRWWALNGRATIEGTDGPNTIITQGGWGRSEGVDVYGKGGDDSLRGGLGYDTLVGGAGRDVADGGGGIDRCRAEVRTHCES